MNELKNLWKSTSLFDKLFVVLFTLSLITVQLITDSTLISLGCSLLGIMYVVLVRMGHKYAMVFGAIQAFIYCVISFTSGIYGDFMLNTYNVVVMTYGYIQWNKNSKEAHLDVRDLDTIGACKVVSVMLGGYVTLLTLLTILGGFNPWLDAFTTVVSMTGLYLTANRYRQCWIAWNLNNLVSVILWTTLYMSGNPNAPVMIFMFGCYLVNSIYATIQWYKKK